jgi:protease YdgD
MAIKPIILFVGITSALTLGSLRWLCSPPVIGAEVVMPTTSPSPEISYQVAPTTTAKPQPAHSDSFIPTSLKQSDTPSPGKRNIFGKDARTPMTASDYPWSSIGRLEAPLGPETLKFCTGTLISKKLVITNAHCAFDDKGKPLQKITFYPNAIGGKARDSAAVTNILAGTNKPDQERSQDWAILTLDQPLGEKYGWMSWMTLDFADLDSLRGQFIQAGYSHDFPTDTPGLTAGVHKGCSIRGFSSRQPGLISHDCDTTRGSSGGPIFTIYKGEPVIVALNAAQRILPGNTEQADKFAADTANFGVLSDNWADAASRLAAKVR